MKDKGINLKRGYGEEFTVHMHRFYVNGCVRCSMSVLLLMYVLNAAGIVHEKTDRNFFMIVR